MVPHTESSSNLFTVEELNDYFASTFFNAVAPAFSNYLDNMDVKVRIDFFELGNATQGDIQNAMSRATSQAVRVDLLPQSLITTTLPFISSHLCNIFNQPLSSSTSPEAGSN